MTTLNLSIKTSPVGSGLYAFGVAIQSTVNATAQKIKAVVTSPLGQTLLGFGIGCGLNKMYVPITERIIRALGCSWVLADPFLGLGLINKILLGPFICILILLWKKSSLGAPFKTPLETISKLFITVVVFRAHLPTSQLVYHQCVSCQ